MVIVSRGLFAKRYGNQTDQSLVLYNYGNHILSKNKTKQNRAEHKTRSKTTTTTAAVARLHPQKRDPCLPNYTTC